MTQFKNRAYGFAVIKAINSNYNADFSGQPRTLPNGQVYANGTTLKYTVRNFIKVLYGAQQRVFVFKRFNDNYNPFTLADSYDDFFKTEVKNEDKKVIIKNLLSAIDVRFFGATFSPKGNGIKDKNVSIYGAVQINDGLNRWYEGNIFTDQILSPYGNPKKNTSEGSSDETEKAASTLGRKSKLEEGHYVHHFSINPKNIEDIARHGAEGTQTLSVNDIELLKEGLRKGATYYDSAAKAGTENEMLFYVELKEGSKLVLPNFTEMVKIKDKKDDGKRYFDLSAVKAELAKHKDEIEKCEIYYNSNNVEVENLHDDCVIFDL